MNLPYLNESGQINTYTVPNAKTGYTLSAADQGRILLLNPNSALLVTIPVGLPQGFYCAFIKIGDAANVTLSPASGVVLGSALDESGDAVITAQFETVELVMWGNNTFAANGFGLAGGGSGDGDVAGPASAVSGHLAVFDGTTGKLIADGGAPVPFTPASASGPATLDFAEDTDNGTSKVVVSAPASLAGDIAVELPSTSGVLALALPIVVADAGASVAPTPADSGKTYRCTNATPTFVPTGTFTIGMGFKVQFSAGAGVFDGSASNGTSQFQGSSETNTFISNTTVTGNQGQLYFIEYIATNRWAVSGIITP